MRDGEMRTDTIDRLRVPAAPKPRTALAAAAAGPARRPAAGRDVWGGGWRGNAPAAVRLRHDRAERRVELGGDVPARRRGGRGRRRLAHGACRGRRPVAGVRDRRRADRGRGRAARRDAREGHAALLAPMPGRVLAFRSRRRPASRRMATVVIEAMKMEHAVTTADRRRGRQPGGARGGPGAAWRPAGRGHGGPDLESPP